MSELVVEKVEYSTDMSKIALTGMLNFKALGKDMKAVMEAVKQLSQEQLIKFEQEGLLTITTDGREHKITSEEMTLSRSVRDTDDPNLAPIADSQTMLVMDFAHDEELYSKYLANEVANRVQKLRKDAQLQFEDPVDMWATAVPNGKKPAAKLQATLEGKAAYLDERLRRRLFSGKLLQGHELLVREEDFTIEGEKLKL